MAITWSGWTPAANAEVVGGATVLTDNGDVYIGFNAGAVVCRPFAYRGQRPRRLGQCHFLWRDNQLWLGTTPGSGMQVMQTCDGSTGSLLQPVLLLRRESGVITVNKALQQRAQYVRRQPNF